MLKATFQVPRLYYGIGPSTFDRSIPAECDGGIRMTEYTMAPRAARRGFKNRPVPFTTRRGQSPRRRLC